MLLHTNGLMRDFKKKGGGDDNHQHSHTAFEGKCIGMGRKPNTGLADPLGSKHAFIFDIMLFFVNDYSNFFLHKAFPPSSVIKTRSFPPITSVLFATIQFLRSSVNTRLQGSVALFPRDHGAQQRAYFSIGRAAQHCTHSGRGVFSFFSNCEPNEIFFLPLFFWWFYSIGCKETVSLQPRQSREPKQRAWRSRWIRH